MGRSMLTIFLTFIIFLFIFNTQAANNKKFVFLLSMEVPRPTTPSIDLNPVDNILPKFVGDVSYRNETLTWTASCFQKNEAWLEFHKNSGKYGGGTLHLKVSEPRDHICTDLYIFATPFSFKPDHFLIHGEHKIEFKKWQGKAEYEYVTNRGLSIFLMPSGMIDTIVALKEAMTMFKNSDEGEKANIEFLKRHMGVNLEERPRPWVTPNINVDDINSGDFLALSKIRGQSGGFETLEKWVTGSYAGHSAVCIRNPDGKLYVAESGRTNEHGEDIVEVLPWEEWWEFEQKKDDGNPHIALLPLHPEIRAKFNKTAAWEFAISMSGNPYGYHNVIFSWIDTRKKNYPSPVDAHVVATFMVIWNKMNHKRASRLWNEELNKRLGTQGLELPEILEEVEERGLSFAELLTVPELDHWEYTDGKSISCVAYVMQIYKAAGIFHPIHLQGTEFTVKDGYQLNIYEDSPSRLPKWCNNEKDQTYCQIIGKYKMELPGYNTIEPYPHMNERCPSLPPFYDRPKSC